MLQARDWTAVEEAFRTTAPYNYAVLDDFLVPEKCTDLHHALLSHWGWRHKNWTSRHLHNNRPNIPAVQAIGAELERNLPGLLSDKSLVAYWGLMYRDNVAGKVHSDLAAVTLTLWLTPQQFNLDPTSGGLLLYDVKRDPEVMPHEHLSAEWSESYVAERTQGGMIKIPYAWNRAVLFDGRTFHKTDELNFATQGPSSFRINLAYAFDDPVLDAERLAVYHQKR